jgi:hypothetical protein
MTPRVRRRVVTVVSALGGAFLFAYAVRGVGWSEVAAGIGRVGWGLIPILSLGGVRFVLRAEAWRRCMPPEGRIPFHQALTAYLAGDAIGNVTPLGLIASEPTKLFLIRHQLATRPAAASLAIDVFVYSASVVVMIALGLVAVLASVQLAAAWRAAIVVALILLAAGAGVGWRLLDGTWTPARGARPQWRARLASLRESVRAFSEGRSGRLQPVLMLHGAFHACAFAEVYLALLLLLPPAAGSGPTMAEAFIFTALDRLVIVIFKFVPFRIGVDEASSGGVAVLLGWPAATGVALAVVKKVRNLVWTGVGLLLIAGHPAQATPAADPHETGPARRT